MPTDLDAGQARNAGRARNAGVARLYLSAVATALAVEACLAVGLVGLVGSILRGSPEGWSLPLQNNWLAVIYKLLAGFGGDQAGQLRVVDGLDVTILALVGVTMIGLFAVLRRASRLWSLLAAAMPFAGIALFVATSSAGRTSVIGAVLVASIVMLRSPSFGKPVAWIGVAAGTCLAIGDVGSAVNPPHAIAALFGFCYVALMVWLALVARQLVALRTEA